MNPLFVIAARNVFRHGKRTALTVATMSVGIGLFIVMDSMIGGMDTGAISNMADLSHSAMRVMTIAYKEEADAYPLDYFIEDKEETARTIRSNPSILAVTPRTKFIGTLSASEFSKPVVGIVLDPATDETVFTLKKSIKGTWFGKESANQVIIGFELAKEMKVDIGSYIILEASTRYDARNADEFMVTGIIESTDPTINRLGVYITYPAADVLLDLEGGVTELDAKMAWNANIKTYLSSTDAAGKTLVETVSDAGLTAISLAEGAKSFLLISGTKQKGGYFLIFIILVIAGIGIINTVLMSVYSRLKEIGVLRAFGFRRTSIRNLFLAEGAIMGILGGVGGLLFGLLLDWPLIKYGIPIEAFAGKMDAGSFPIWGTIYGNWNPGSIAFGFAFGIVAALLASLIPARKAERLEIAETLKFV